LQANVPTVLSGSSFQNSPAEFRRCQPQQVKTLNPYPNYAASSSRTNLPNMQKERERVAIMSRCSSVQQFGTTSLRIGQNRRKLIDFKKLDTDNSTGFFNPVSEHTIIGFICVAFNIYLYHGYLFIQLNMEVYVTSNY
jgi:hypothetical protein